MAGTTLGTAYVQIVPSAKGIKGSITSALGGEAQSAGTAIGGRLGAFAKKAIAAVGIGTAVVKGVKASMAEGAKLQQSYLGGVDTLYGKAAESVRGFARDAAKYGISMNDYSEQAVSFGAALKKAYGRDAVKAAKAADVAIKDMADNQAKMGTDIGSIQMAYQGFAKQNYTMLDNLKLGYGGTKSEMQRLLSDAEKLTGVHYDIDNLGDVYSAIHAIQQDLGLTGTAAKEASTTFSGSFQAMKASVANLLGSIAIGQNVKPAMKQFVTSFSTFFFGNVIPMIGTILKSLPGAISTFISTGIPILLQNIVKLVGNLANSLKTAADGITGGKVKAWITTTVPKVLSAAKTLIARFAKGLISKLPTIISAIARIGAAIVKGLGSALWGKVKQAANGIKERFMAPIKSMKDKVKGILDKIKNFFPVDLGKILNFSLPRISVSGGKAPWGIGGKGTKPSFSVSWASHALGGIFKKRTFLSSGNVIHEFGEAGREAIVPLDPFWKKMDEIAKNTQGNTVNIYINGADKDPKTIAQEVKRVLVRETNNRRLAWQ